MADFRVMQLDHVELFVPDRHEAARWYRDVLGLQILSEYKEWAEAAGGPLMIATPHGGTKLALFTGDPQGTKPTAGFHRVAFRVDAPGFTRLIERLDQVPLADDRGRRVTPESVVDHGKAFSVYFADPYGHRLEVTCYEHQAVRAALDAARERGRQAGG